ncbi:transposase [Streptomyces kronopolitis]
MIDRIWYRRIIESGTAAHFGSLRGLLRRAGQANRTAEHRRRRRRTHGAAGRDRRPCRFLTESHFARWCGAAPLAVSSGEGHGRALRHRLDRGGNRKVNSVLHIVHVTQVRCHDPARSFMARKINASTPKCSARRPHKRQLASVIIRQMRKDAPRGNQQTSTPANCLTRELRAGARQDPPGSPRRSDFSPENAALKCVYRAVMPLDPPAPTANAENEP